MSVIGKSKCLVYLLFVQRTIKRNGSILHIIRRRFIANANMVIGCRWPQYRYLVQAQQFAYLC